LSDFIAQSIERHDPKHLALKNSNESMTASSSNRKSAPEYDVKRTIAVASCAPIFNGGICLFFYRFIDNLFGTAPTLRTAFTKMMVCQFTYMPFSAYLFLFLSKLFHRGLCGDSWSDMYSAARANSKGKVAEAYLSSWAIWPASDMVCFTVIQRWNPHFRTTWDSLMDLVWNVYLCWVGLGDDSLARFVPLWCWQNPYLEPYIFNKYHFFGYNTLIVKYVSFFVCVYII
jgi:hypothetical protein